MLEDRRIIAGDIWNIDELCRRFALSKEAPAAGEGARDGVDRFIYAGFRKAGATFLEWIEGRFACAYFDPDRRVLFLARDWIGEAPLHWIASRRGFVVANTIAALRESVPDSYSYRFVRAFPQSKYMEIDFSEVDQRCVSETCRFREDALYYDFRAACEHLRRSGLQGTRAHLELVRDALERSTARRTGPIRGKIAVLLSGGLDSLSVALMLRSMGVPFVAYTLSIGSGGDDVRMATQFARHLGVEHRIVRVEADDVLRVAPEVVSIAETYHLYNYLCAVGMYLLGSRIAEDGFSVAFCGEAVNEALGDYKDWSVADEASGERRVLQHVNHQRMSQSSERVLYVWGQERDRGKYNRQLGTGLAKHAGSRMVKPFLRYGLKLESPYYDRSVLSHLVSLPADALAGVGGKPGLVMSAFRADLERLHFPNSLVLGCSKVRLQDASEGGRGGITPIMLGAGYDQRRLVELFNEAFCANLDPRLESERLLASTG